MISKIITYLRDGIDGFPVTLEAETSPGIGIHITGLADAAVKESLLRTVTALQSHGYHIPAKKVVFNFKPGLPDNTPHTDLPLALAFIELMQDKRLNPSRDILVAGELGLDGSLRAVGGGYIAARTALLNGYKAVILPAEDAMEALPLRYDVAIYAANNLVDAVAIMEDIQSEKAKGLLVQNILSASGPKQKEATAGRPRLSTVELRAYAIAAAGGFDVAVCGNTQENILDGARILRELLFVGDRSLADTISCIYSAARKPYPEVHVPFREVTASVSPVALLGGGICCLPGEVSLAHGGVLAISEPETMPKSTFEALRHVREDGIVTIRRLKHNTVYPAAFKAVFGVAPCPCGAYGKGDKCTCTPEQVREHREKVANTLAQWRTICIRHDEAEARNVTDDEVLAAQLRASQARATQRKRYKDTAATCNANARWQDLGLTKGDTALAKLAETVFEKTGLSVQRFTDALRIARTIADLEGKEEILPEHVVEAASYLFLFRKEA